MREIIAFILISIMMIGVVNAELTIPEMPSTKYNAVFLKKGEATFPFTQDINRLQPGDIIWVLGWDDDNVRLCYDMLNSSSYMKYKFVNQNGDTTMPQGNVRYRLDGISGTNENPTYGKGTMKTTIESGLSISANHGSKIWLTNTNIYDYSLNQVYPEPEPPSEWEYLYMPNECTNATFNNLAGQDQEIRIWTDNATLVYHSKWNNGIEDIVNDWTVINETMLPADGNTYEIKAGEILTVTIANPATGGATYAWEKGKGLLVLRSSDGIKLPETPIDPIEPIDPSFMNPPNRDDYEPGIFGTIAWIMATVVYYLKLPFQVIGNLFQSFFTLLNNLFQQIGQAKNVFSDTLSFMPTEMTAIIIMGFVVSILLRIFKY